MSEWKDQKVRGKVVQRISVAVVKAIADHAKKATLAELVLGITTAYNAHLRAAIAEYEERAARRVQS